MAVLIGACSLACSLACNELSGGVFDHGSACRGDLGGACRDLAGPGASSARTRAVPVTMAASFARAMPGARWRSPQIRVDDEFLWCHEAQRRRIRVATRSGDSTLSVFTSITPSPRPRPRRCCSSRQQVPAYFYQVLANSSASSSSIRLPDRREEEVIVASPRWPRMPAVAVAVRPSSS